MGYDAGMKHPVVLRVEKLTTMGNLAGSAEHTWRQRPTRTADSARTKLNEDWRDVSSSQALQEAVKARLATLTEKPNAKRTLCLEYLVTANYEAFKEGGGDVDWRAYFKDSVSWLERLHGAQNVVAVNIQHDELTPHLVVYVVPLVEESDKKVKRSVITGKNVDGSLKREVREVIKKGAVRLGASTFIDGRKKLSQMQTDFASAVGTRHGLLRGIKGSSAIHVTTKEWQDALSVPVKHGFLKPEAFVPKVLKKGFITSEVESDEERAQRVMGLIHRHYEKPLQVAKTAQIDRKRSKELTQTLSSIQSYYGEYFERIDALKKLGVGSRDVLAMLDKMIAQREQENQRVDECIELVAQNMIQALKIDDTEALERARDLLAGGHSEEFEGWLRHETSVPPHDLVKADRAQQAKDFISNQKNSGDEPGFGL